MKRISDDNLVNSVCASLPAVGVTSGIIPTLGVGHVTHIRCTLDIRCTSRVPVEGKSSVCLICMNYRIIF